MKLKKQQRVIRKQQQRISWLRRRLNVCHKKPKKQVQQGDSQLNVLKHISKTLPILVEMQLKNVHVKPNGRRWSDEMYHFASGLHYTGPQAYRFMSTIMLLPSKKSLHKWMTNVEISEGFSEDVFKLMHIKAKALSKREKLCTIMLDEMSIKYHADYNRRLDKVIGLETIKCNEKAILANHVIVFMACGTCSNWRQALGCHFVFDMCDANILQTLIRDCLTYLTSAGYIPVNVTCDQGANFRGLANKLGITIEKPYFYHNEQKIFFLFDPPHLLKSFRNNFRAHSILFNNGKSANWCSVKTAFEIDSVSHYRCLPKITNQHIYGGTFTKMSVRMASQVISHTMSATIGTFVEQNQMEAKHMQAAELIELVNNCNDCLNSSRIYGDAPFRSALSDNNTKVIDQLKRSASLFSTMRVVQANGRNVAGVQFINGYKITINAVLQLFEHLKSFYGIRYLLTRKLCQDPLENFFSVMRQKGGCSDSPTALRFTGLFKKACVNKLLKPFGTGNCEVDKNLLLIEYSSSAKNSSSTNKNRNSTNFNNNQNNIFSIPVTPVSIPRTGRLVPHTASIRRLNLHAIGNNPRITDSQSFQSVDNDEYNDEKGAFTSTCGAVIRKIRTIHTCQICEDNLYGTRQLDSESKRFMYNKAFTDNFGCYTVPSAGFVNYLRLADGTFENVFNTRGHEAGIIMLCETTFKQKVIPCPSPCKHFPVEKLLKYFFRTRIHYTLMFFNKNLPKHGTHSAKNKKLLKIQSQ